MAYHLGRDYGNPFINKPILRKRSSELKPAFAKHMHEPHIAKAHHHIPHIFRFKHLHAINFRIYDRHGNIVPNIKASVLRMSSMLHPPS